MSDKVYQVVFAGHPVTCAFLFPQTRYLFRPLPALVEGAEANLRVTPELIAKARNFLPEDSSDPYVEYRCLIELTGRWLLQFGCCIFHSVSFFWRDRAWLLTAPSGVGKTTQFLNWKRLHPGEITMISGDMPVIEGREDGAWVHPSAWNGKENMSSGLSAPLGGIVLLEQGSENLLQPLSPREGVMRLLAQFIASPETEQEALALTGLLEKMLLAAPGWKFINLGDDASTELLRAALLTAAEKGRDR